jgi:predicted nucleic acid-binding protein
MKEVVLDAGALIALERGQHDARSMVLLAEQGMVVLVTSCAAVAQVWRGGGRQVRIARVLASGLVAEVPLDSAASRRIGVLAATRKVTDVVDGHIAALALERDAVVMTSDPEDIARWGVLPSRILGC